MGYVIDKGESHIFGGLWDQHKKQTRVKSWMDTYIP